MSNQDSYIKGFMACLRSEKKGVFIRHLFVDLNNGNWSDAALFSQVCFIFAQLNDEGYRHYSLHEYRGETWISLSYAQWWHVCRLNKNTVRAIIRRVQSRGLIITEHMPTDEQTDRLIIRINYEQFSRQLQSIIPPDRIDHPPDRFDHPPLIESITPPDRIDHPPLIESITPPDRIDHPTIFKEIEDLEEDQKEHSLRSPECVREKCNSEFEPEESRSDESVKPIALVSPERIGEDRFSAAPLNSSIEEFPIGPWGRDLFSIHPGFMAAVITKWRKGNSEKAQAFGSMADEEVRGCIQKYWRKDWTNLQLDWTEYEESTKRLAQTVRDRMAQGVEITPQEQKILTDRVMGPEHLRPAIAHSASRQSSSIPTQVQRQGTATIGALPVALSEISESQLEETRRAIESARASIAPIALSAQLFSGKEPIPEFLAWLEPQIEANKIPGLSRRQTAIALARRPQMQKAFLESQDNQPHEDF